MIQLKKYTLPSGTELNIHIQKTKEGFDAKIMYNDNLVNKLNVDILHLQENEIVDGFDIECITNGFHLVRKSDKTLIYDYSNEKTIFGKSTFIDIVYDKEIQKANFMFNDLLLCHANLSAESKKMFDRRDRFKGVLYKTGEVMIVRYASLHEHSTYSIDDAINTIESIAEYTEYYSALSDHGNMYGALKFNSAMQKFGKKPIFGFEGYIEDFDEDIKFYTNQEFESEEDKKEYQRKHCKGRHILFLAKNQTGFKNLIKLTTEGQEFKYNRPHLRYDILDKYHEGLICTTACFGGTLPKALLAKNDKLVKKYIEQMISWFGKDDFYIEIQRHETKDMITKRASETPIDIRDIRKMNIDFVSEKFLGKTIINEIISDLKDDDEDLKSPEAIIKYIQDNYKRYLKSVRSFNLNFYVDFICSQFPAIEKHRDEIVKKFNFVTDKKFHNYDIDKKLVTDVLYYFEEDYVNKKLIALAREYDLKIIATNDSHYSGKDDGLLHELWLCKQNKKTMNSADHRQFPGEGYHLYSSDEMAELFKDMPEALDNTLEIAEKCNVSLKVDEYFLPDFPLPEGFNSQLEYFKHLCSKGFAERFKGTDKYRNKTYIDRMKFEIATIERMGFPSYFLIVQDFIKWSQDDKVAEHVETYFPKNHYNLDEIPDTYKAKDFKIYIGPGRGSAAGSLVAYCLGITQIDPIEFDLLFERFLNPSRISMPDIDTDIDDELRHYVFNYTRIKYGYENTSRIIAFSTAKPKAAVGIVQRNLDMPLDIKDKICDTIPNAPKTSFKSTMKESIEFNELYKNDEEAKKCIDYAMKLENLVTGITQHACFDEDTLITTDKGLKKISEIKCGDNVLTHNNRFKPVVDVMVNESDDIYDICVNSTLPTRVTGNHPFYTRKSRDEKPHWKNVKNLDYGDLIGIAINNNEIIPEGNLPFDKEDFWLFLGRLVPNCWATAPYFYCNKDKREYEYTLVLFKELNIKYSHQECDNYHCFKLEDADEFLNYFKSFGNNIFDKHLNKDILNLPRNLLKAFVYGFTVACQQDTYALSVNNKELAVGVIQAIAKSYHRYCSVKVNSHFTTMLNNSKVSHSEYRISYSDFIQNRHNAFYENNYLWVPFKSKEKTSLKKEMYNLTVLDDSSYIANGMIVHNCGFLITPTPVTDYIPQILLKDNQGIEQLTTQWDKDECEAMGCLKMDYLGLRTLSLIRHSLFYINKIRESQGNKPLDMYDIDIYDKKIYEYISTGDTGGVFQIESPGMKNLMVQLFKDCHSKSFTGKEGFNRLSAAIALYRPGPMDEIGNYLLNMANPDDIHYETPLLKKRLKETYGVIVYQEQAMLICRDLAGFSEGDADKVRKGMAKKVDSILSEYREYFIYGSVDKGIKGCINNGISEEVASSIWEKMEKFGSYAFNKSHSVAYAFLVAYTAWLACYYPNIYMSSLLTSFTNNSEKLQEYLNITKYRNINILPPDINNSFIEYTPDGSDIRIGLMGISGIGKITESIIEEREENGEFTGLFNVMERMTRRGKSLNKKNLEALIYSGTFDSFGLTRNTMINAIESYSEKLSFIKPAIMQGQMTLFDYVESNPRTKNIPQVREYYKGLRNVEIEMYAEIEKQTMLKLEREYAGIYITEHPLDEYSDILQKEHYINIEKFLPETSEDMDGNIIINFSEMAKRKKVVKVAGVMMNVETFYTKKDNKPLSVFTLEDTTGSIGCIVFNETRANCLELIESNTLVAIEGQLQIRDEKTQLVVRSIIPINSVGKQTGIEHVLIVLPDDELEMRSKFTKFTNIAKNYEAKDNDFKTKIHYKLGTSPSAVVKVLNTRVKWCASLMAELSELFTDIRVFNDTDQ